MSSGDLRRLARKALPGGVRRAGWSALDRVGRLQQAAFERRLGVRTEAESSLDDDTLGSDRNGYEGCEWIPVRRALRSSRPPDDDVFVDLGSGTGQGLLIAAGLPYRSVTGIELDPVLHQLAQENLARAMPRLRCTQVRSVSADVLEWELPDDVSTVFLFSPFTGEVFTQALARVLASYDRRPRPLRVVYAYPWEHDWLVSTGRVRVEDVLPAQWPTRPWWWRTTWVIVTYRVVPEGQGRLEPPQLRRRLYRPQRAIARWSGPNGNQDRVTRRDS